MAVGSNRKAEWNFFFFLVKIGTSRGYFERRQSLWCRGVAVIFSVSSVWGFHRTSFQNCNFFIYTFTLKNFVQEVEKKLLQELLD